MSHTNPPLLRQFAQLIIVCFILIFIFLKITKISHRKNKIQVTEDFNLNDKLLIFENIGQKNYCYLLLKRIDIL